ncbi:putative F-box protein At3g52320 [Neltuma alba]|uniref:putative F-box protein At3g52320 n=1 Tax=Neltuma alba TaxID=207710 RepID=UPI0010A3BCDF|nr:putative F-box protein At3g52320 [Prosopis alba]
MDGAAPYLPEEVIANILKRLPMKSIIRFQCVCKYWRDLIKTPSFIQDHFRHSSLQNPSLFIGQSNGDDPFRLYLLNCKMQLREFDKAPFVGPLVGVCLVGSCNGLLCLADYNIRPPAPLLWNPATRETRQIPITFNDSRICWEFGFGFSPIINDYKIVRISLNPCVCDVEVYSLSKGSWRNIPFDDLKDICINNHGVNVNGVLFWDGIELYEGVMDDDTDDTDVDTIVIVSFDIASEVFTAKLSPTSRCKLAVNDDKLAIISPNWITDSPDSSIYFGELEEVIGLSEDIWSSRDYILSYAFNLHELYVGSVWRNQIVCIDFGMHRSDKLRMENAEHLYLIHLTTNERKMLTLPTLKSGHDVSDFKFMERPVTIANFQIARPGFGFSVFNYVGSLMPIDNIQIEEP